jgi:hypothetical protein
MDFTRLTQYYVPFAAHTSDCDLLKTKGRSEERLERNYGSNRG